MKQRTVHLIKAVPELTVDFIKSILLRIIGVESVKITDKAIDVFYDLNLIEEIEIEKVLAEVKLAIENGWFERVQKKMMHQQEENEHEKLIPSKKAIPSVFEN